MGPLIRNLGSMLVRGVQPREVMMQYMAKSDSPTGGKDGNTHFGDLKRGLVAPISMLGAVIPVMAGVALAGKMQGKDLVAITYIGDGGTSTGDFHEGLNLAAVLNVPFVLIAENNGWAYSTPTRQADADQEHRRPGRRLRHPRRDRGRQRRARRLRGHQAGRRRARAPAAGRR